MSLSLNWENDEPQLTQRPLVIADKGVDGWCWSGVDVDNCIPVKAGKADWMGTLVVYAFGVEGQVNEAKGEPDGGWWWWRW